MPEGAFRLAIQRGSAGYYGVIRLRVECVPAPGLAVTYRADVETRWRQGTAFGIAYAYERCVRASAIPDGAAVCVEDMRGQLVDTREVVMAYVAAMAFFSAVSVACPSGMRFEAESGEFVFPK